MVTTVLAIYLLVVTAAYGTLIYRLAVALNDLTDDLIDLEEVSDAWTDVAVERFEALKAVVLLQNHALVGLADKVYPKDTPKKADVNA